MYCQFQFYERFIGSSLWRQSLSWEWLSISKYVMKLTSLLMTITTNLFFCAFFYHSEISFVGGWTRCLFVLIYSVDFFYFHIQACFYILCTYFSIHFNFFNTEWIFNIYSSERNYWVEEFKLNNSWKMQLFKW